MKRMLSFDSPLVMGILNLTPDSFYDGGVYNNVENALIQTQKMISEGADIIDIGGMSSRPGAEIISKHKELDRIKEVFLKIRQNFPEVLISIDTVHSNVAEFCLENDADFINDISSSSIDPELIKVVSKYQCPYVLMHMQNLPENMQDQPSYENVTMDVLKYFINKLSELKSKNIHNVIIDVGFGFGKTVDQNFQLLSELSVFKVLEKPILLGVSRKSSISKLLNIQKEDTLPATTALHLKALENGANILRVHDVREAKQAIKLYQQFN